MQSTSKRKSHVTKFPLVPTLEHGNQVKECVQLAGYVAWLEDQIESWFLTQAGKSVARKDLSLIEQKFGKKKDGGNRGIANSC